MPKFKILIVEDEKNIRNALKEKLIESGFEVIEAVNGKEGLEKIKQQKPDLALVDVAMPVMDGLQMVKKARKTKEGANLNIILLTNVDDDKNAAEALKCNVFNYFIKTDWKLDEIANFVRQQLNEPK